MEVKLLEVRDDGTRIAVMATRMASDVPAEQHLLRSVGFPLTGLEVALTYLSGERASSVDPYFWGNRTMMVAHEYIRENFATLTSGDVVDVEFIKGERATPKASEVQPGPKAAQDAPT